MDELITAAEALSVLTPVIARIGPDDMGKPTACHEYDVAALTEHLHNSIATLGGAAGAQLPKRDPGALVEPQLLPAARAALAAWQRRGTDGDIELGSQPFPARFAVGILALEFLVHAWDYTVAVGGEVGVSDQVAASVLGLAREIITPEGRAEVGFDQPIEVPDDASAFDRLLAFTGRRPVM